jgi:hypothetical protein
MQILTFIATIAAVGAYRVTPARQSIKMSSSISNTIRVGAIALLTSGFIQTSAPVIAANYGGFGSSYSAVVAPKDAVIDSDLANSDDFKKGQEGLAKTLDKIKSIRSDFTANTQMNVGARLTSELSLSDIRINLNKYSAAFSEDTQKGSDRLIRQVIQGLTELGRESTVKEGKTRSTAKAANVERRLAAVSDALESLSQYYTK